MRTKRFLFLRITLSLLILLSFLAAFAAHWYQNVYGDLGFPAILSTLNSDLSGVDRELLRDFLHYALLPALFCALPIDFFLYLWPQKRITLHGFALYPPPLPVSVLCTVVGCLFLLHFAANRTQFYPYIHNTFEKSTVFEESYIDPNRVEIHFPEKKQNIVYLFMESMETSYFSQNQGGAMKQDLIPELYMLAENNTNFSHNDGVGGFREMTEASWTIGSMVAQTAGIPLKAPDFSQNNYGSKGEQFLPGAATLMDILHDNGYYQALMVGSDADFGGRKSYFLQHGCDEVYDLFTAPSYGIQTTEQAKWGLADRQLYAYAKQELTKISQQDQPFAFTLLTADTHHVGGYQCVDCIAEDGEPYEQSISCASRQAAEFLLWLQEQPFYENTTVIITGDHLSMDKQYFLRKVSPNYGRRIYHCIINAPLKPLNEKKREYCAVDLFPTTLAALGCEIEGERLGLGTNLYSALPTLSEKMGFETFDSELSKGSDFYSSFYQ